MQLKRFSVKSAIQEMKKLTDALNKNDTQYSHALDICQGIRLLYPGKLGHGDYLLQFNEIPFSHEDFCRLMIEDINAAVSPEQKYKKWMILLEDVFYNGTMNITDSNNDEFLIKSLVFWITLQEEINYPNGMGRLHPFCRYAEAIGSTRTSMYTFDDILSRINNKDNPRHFKKLDFPDSPSYYNW